jgi:hypothetical protein
MDHAVLSEHRGPPARVGELQRRAGKALEYAKALRNRKVQLSFSV